MTVDIGERVQSHATEIAVLRVTIAELKSTIERRGNWSVATTIAACILIIAAMGFLKAFTTDTIASRLSALEVVVASDNSRINGNCQSIAAIEATLRLRGASTMANPPWSGADAQ
jgi:uncharacterized membrane protein YvbJ